MERILFAPTLQLKTSIYTFDEMRVQFKKKRELSYN